MAFWVIKIPTSLMTGQQFIIFFSFEIKLIYAIVPENRCCYNKKDGSQTGIEALNNIPSFFFFSR